MFNSLLKYIALKTQREEALKNPELYKNFVLASDEELEALRNEINQDE